MTAPRSLQPVTLSQVKNLLDTRSLKEMSEDHIESLRAFIEALRDQHHAKPFAPHAPARPEDVPGFSNGDALKAIELLRSVIPRVRQWRGPEGDGDERLAQLQEALFLAQQHLVPPWVNSRVKAYTRVRMEKLPDSAEQKKPWQQYAGTLAREFQRIKGKSGKAPGISKTGPVAKFVAAASALVTGEPAPEVDATGQFLIREMKIEEFDKARSEDEEKEAPGIDEELRRLETAAEADARAKEGQIEGLHLSPDTLASS